MKTDTSTPVRRLLLGLVLVTLSVGISLAASEDVDQRIFLDPDTGEVLAQPPADQPGATDSGNGSRADQSAFEEQGVTRQAVHCPDGSLRMGQAKAHPGENERDALCAAKKR